jgi:hypothetical protein
MDAKETIEKDFENCWKTEWESKAKEILEKQDMEGLKKLCVEIFWIASGEFLAF